MRYAAKGLQFEDCGFGPGDALGAATRKARSLAWSGGFGYGCHGPPRKPALLELPLERICETILVGVIASLCLLSVLFFFFGHVFRITFLRRISQFLFYEQDRVEVAPHAEHEEGAASRSHSPPAYVLLLLTAGLYGLGVITESTSDMITSVRIPGLPVLISDPATKEEAFREVGHGNLASGTAPAEFVRFVTDHEACRASGIREEDSSPCEDIYAKAKGLYYNAKNLVFQTDTYQKELSALQSRINFARSLSQALALLALELFVAFLFAAVTEYLYQHVHSKAGIIGRVYPRLPAWVRALGAHWRNLDATRCSLLVAALVVATYVAQHAWYDCESQFDRRVFGYFLALRERSAPLLPKSSYDVFALAPGQRFEPSAADTLGASSRIIVANDKGGEHPFVLFDLLRSDALEHPVVLAGGPFGPSREQTITKVEALHSFVRDEKTHVLACSTLDAEQGNERLVLSFVVEEGVRTIAPDAGSPGSEAPTPYADAIEVQRMDDDPCDALPTTPGVRQTCFVEGMALGSSEDELLLGIRQVRSGAKQARKPVIALVRMQRTLGVWKNPKLALLLASPPDGCRGLSGISGLEPRADGGLYVLTSIELEGDQHCEEPVEPDKAPVARVRGALWLLGATSTGEYRWPEAPLQKFAHKPEGLAELDDGSVLVVFDDDGQRKSISHAPKTFALEQNEAVFTIVPAGPLPNR